MVGMSATVSTQEHTAETQHVMDLEKDHLLQTYARYPVVLHRGKGCYVYDTDGNRYIDLITGIGVLGVGLGFGMQGLLSNMVAGLTIIFTRPFRVGDYIELLGVQGAVVHIDIVSTTLAHLDYSKLIIPNHKIIGEILHNFGAVRQLTLTVGVGYQTDLKRACDLVAAVLERLPRVVRG